MSVLDFVLRFLAAGMASAAVAALAHKLPWPKRVTERRPYTCPICWTGWSTIGTLLVLSHWPAWWFGWSYAFLWAFASYGVALIAYRYANPPDIQL